jgi:ABC-type nitrate/sulfonate/bicarbonate transport system substrate-binding protein
LPCSVNAKIPIMKKRVEGLSKPAFRLIIIAVLICAAFANWSCSERSYSRPAVSATLATLHLESSALVYIADDQHFFDKNGLSLKILEYDSGVETLGAVQNGQADLAGLSEFVTVRNIMQAQKVKVLGSFDKCLSASLMAIKSRGINQLADLAGKRIGLPLATAAEFYLDRFLEINGLDFKDLTLVDLAPSSWMEAVAAGKADAIAGWPPYLEQIQNRFPNDTLSWPIQSDQPVFGLVVSNSDWADKNPEANLRFWKSLAQAEDLARRKPDLAKEIVQKHLSFDKAYVDTIWPQYSFTISLDQSLIIAMEEEARWLIDENMTPQKSVPNFLKYISESGLKAASQAAVTIIR